ncbi:MAG: poly(beta-D-mannuronate) O-acetylase [Myxococcaceae bacterium]|nr:poly(beta-D-mannuronate) O-acetylase [Myxococcaceae bacterium]
MMFHSAQFLALVGVAFAAFWAVSNNRWPRLMVLFVASLVFYGAWNPAPLVIFAAYCLVNWGGGHLLERVQERGVRKAILVAALCFHLGILIIYKYLDLFLGSLGSLASKLELTWKPEPIGMLLPIGLSFVAFQAISFIVDVYRRQTSGKRSLFHQALYLLFFPQVVAGPIIRSKDLLERFDAKPRVTAEEGAAAIFRIAQGIAKKLLIADVLAVSLVDPIFTNPGGYSAAECALASVAYTFQIYFDFSGYSDIAVGCGALFGFKWPENFNKPYHATNLFEFWNRWHVSLSTWLRDYLYRPLGGNQGSKFQTLRNLMLVMSLGGLWHGADWKFLLWGGIHGALLVVWRIVWWQVGKPKGEASLARKISGWLLMFNAVVFARIFFRADTMDLARAMFSQLFTFTVDMARVSSMAWVSFAACVILYAMPKVVFEKSQWLFIESPIWLRTLALIALALSIRQIASFESQPYIYFQY